MRVIRLTIDRFRTVKDATLHFGGHTLFIGPNNVGKSTLFEALDLVLGPDRLAKFPALDEFDFYNADYLDDQDQPIPLRVEVVLTNLSAEVQNTCGAHLEFWLEAEQRILTRGEAELANAPKTVPCLRLETVGKYDPDEDEFEAHTYYSHGIFKADGSPETVSRPVKRMIGFVYLRTLRTGSRALSLERNSLLDIILRVRGVRTGLWDLTGVSVPHLSPSQIARFPIALPPLQEQQRIVALIEGALAALAKLETHVASAIVLLQERRSALISAAVTGKIDVRNLAPASAEAA